MKATFTYAVCYQIAAHCLTPLRTAGVDGNTEEILIDITGKPFIQGTSLCGAMRAWTEAEKGEAVANILFGAREIPGHLIVSEGHFSESTEKSIRPRLRIDPATGSALFGGKFDVAQVNAGAEFSFEVIWLGLEKDKEELQIVEEIFSALNGGEIRLGAQKSNGFGRVELTVTKQVYDLLQPEDREAWLKGAAKKQPVKLAQCKNKKYISFTVVGHADSILIKSSVAKHTESGSCIQNLSEGGRFMLPGSSIKGAIRARAAMIAESMGIDACFVQSLFGRENGSEDNGLPGRVLFEDAYLDTGDLPKISRIRINRFTGGVMRGGLFSESPVCSNVKLTISVPADCPEGCALLLYCLRDLGMGLYNLGSGGSIGRGYLQIKYIEMFGAERKARINIDEERQCTVTDSNGMVTEWLKAWEELTL